jgi:hypothetical protein
MTYKKDSVINFKCFEISRVPSLREKGYGILKHTIIAHYVHHDVNRSRYIFFRKVNECRGFDKIVASLSFKDYTVKI